MKIKYCERETNMKEFTHEENQTSSRDGNYCFINFIVNFNLTLALDFNLKLIDL